MEKKERSLEISPSIPNTSSKYLKVCVKELRDLLDPKNLVLHPYMIWLGDIRINKDHFLHVERSSIEDEDKILYFSNSRARIEKFEPFIIDCGGFEYHATWVKKEIDQVSFPSQRFLYALKMEIF